MAVIISADEIKKRLPNYSPDKSEEFHHESAVMADKLFLEELKKSSYTEVILLNGGTASGKTEFLDTQLRHKNCIILDATLSTELGAKNKIRQIIKAGKTPIIYSVIPDDLKRAFVAFLSRDRKFSDVHFYKTHSGSRNVLQWVARNYPDIQINIVESTYTSQDKLQFSRTEFSNREKLLEYLFEIQVTEDGIIRQLSLLK
jgi:hypothetical protein